MSYALNPNTGIISSYRNNENELVTLQRVNQGDFEGSYLLCVHDDDPPLGTGRIAPTLLDEGLRQFLMSELDELGEQS